MPNQKNTAMLEKVAASLEASQGLFVIDYRGLTVKESEELRRSLREAGADMKVYKNNIVRLALKNAEMPELDVEGTCAYIFFEKDPVEAAKAIKGASEKLHKLAFVAGIADGKALSAEDAKAYADLASREELMAQLVYVMASPLRGIASVCAGPARGLVTALDAIAEQKQAA